MQATQEQRGPGRPKKDPERKVTRRELKDKELLVLLRKIKPHISGAVMAAARIMEKENSTDVNKLKAAALFIEQYRRLSLDLYDGEDLEVEVEEIEEEVEQKPASVFSLVRVEKGDEET